MNGIRLIIIALAMQTSAAFASVADTMAAVEHYSLWHDVLQENRQNPVFMLDAYARSYSELGLYADYKHANRPLLYEVGKGNLLWGAAAKSYIRLSKRTSVWGSASYRTGRKYAVKWNSTSDYLLLRPYVMGDTLGGDLHNERYTFSGGYAVQLGKLALGASIDFRAEHEYRTTDPRMRGISTDMTLRGGAKYALGDYEAGIGVGGTFYKQTNDVKFFREAGVIPEYQMSGLGADYERFSGSNRSAYYKSTGILTDIALRPIADRSGIYVTANYRFAPYKRILPSLNSLPLSTLYLTNGAVTAGCKHEGNIGWSVFGGISHEGRKGDEHIAGSPSGSEYRTIATLTMYHSRLNDYHAGGACSLGSGTGLTIELRGGYQDFASDYVSPERKMSFSKAYGALDAQWIKAFGNVTQLVWNLHTAFYANTRKAITMPYATMDEARTDLVNHTYEALTTNYAVAGTDVRLFFAPKKWKGYGAFVSFSGGYTGNETYHSLSLKCSAGITF